MLWINFLHFYQPANSDSYHIKEAVDLSYKRVVTALEKNPAIKFTLNISGCLILRLVELKYFGLLKRIDSLIKNGQIEIVGSAAYHPLLPLIKKEEVVRQIEENENIIKKYLPNAKLKGFFLPEMAYSPEVAKIIKNAGYVWLILDEISLDPKNKLDFSKIYKDKNSDLKIIFRSRSFSNCYAPDRIVEILKRRSVKDGKRIIITATDGELYGLRHKDPRKKFEKILKNKKLLTNSVSGFIKNKKTTEVLIRNSNWESNEKKLAKNEPYHLWYSQKNKIHLKLWTLADSAYEKMNKYKKDINASWSRWHFVRGLASCTFWWASNNDFKDSFGPIAWNPDEIERGANEFIRAIRSLEYSTSKKEKISAEILFIEIKKMIWTRHWSRDCNL